MKTSEVFVGIDVSKAPLAIGVLPAEQCWTTPNNTLLGSDLNTLLGSDLEL